MFAAVEEGEEESGMSGIEGCHLDLVFCKAAARAVKT